MQRTKDYNLRLATQEDVLNIVIIAKEAYLEATDTEAYSFDPQKILSLAQNSIEKDDFLVLILEKDGEVVGYFFGMVTECFFAVERQSVNLSWFISKSHRSLKNALSILKVYEDWSKKSGAVVTNMVDIKLNSDKIFKRLGYTLTENTYVKRNF